MPDGQINLILPLSCTISIRITRKINNFTTISSGKTHQKCWVSISVKINELLGEPMMFFFHNFHFQHYIFRLHCPVVFLSLLQYFSSQPLPSAPEVSHEKRVNFTTISVCDSTCEFIPRNTLNYSLILCTPGILVQSVWYTINAKSIHTSSHKVSSGYEMPSA